MEKHEKYLVVYLNPEKTSMIVVRPTSKFNGDWKGLVDTVSHSDDNTKGFHSYEVKSTSA